MVIFGAGASYDSALAFPLPEVYSVRVGLALCFEAGHLQKEWE
jgi:hypothetical protein